MAYQLVAEVLDHAPTSLTPAERLVLVAVAEWARLESRQCARSARELAARVGVSPDSIGKVLLRLKQHGVEIRVAIAMDKRGEPLYAVPGRVSTFELPTFPAPPGCQCQACKVGPSSDLQGGPPSDLDLSKVGPSSDLRGEKVGPSSGQGGRGSGQGGPGSDPSRIRSRDAVDEDDGAPRCADPPAADPRHDESSGEQTAGFGIRVREIAEAVAHIVEELDEPDEVATTAVTMWLDEKDRAGTPVMHPANYVRSFVRHGKAGQLTRLLRLAREAHGVDTRPASPPPPLSIRVGQRPTCKHCMAGVWPDPAWPDKPCPPDAERQVQDPDGRIRRCPDCNSQAGQTTWRRSGQPV